MISNVYILTPVELTVIAAAKDLGGIFSIHNTGKAADVKMVIQALNHLYQEEFILNAEDDGFVLEAGLQELITGIKEAKAIVLIRHFSEGARMKTIYIGRQLVAMEQRKQNLSSIRIYEIPREELMNFIFEDIKQETKSYRSVLDEEHLFLEGIQKKHILQDDEVENMGNIITMVEKITPQNNKVSSRMVAKNENERIRYTQEEKELQYLKEEEFLNGIVDMIEEELDDIS